ncbi:MAG: type II secretion system protein [Christensenellaceae bacterium]
MKKNLKKGFTIIELVIVIAVIGILMAVLIPTFTGVVDKANKSAAAQEARSEYTAYLAETAPDSEMSVLIQVGTGDNARYFVVVDGQFDVDPVDAPESNAITYDSVSYTVGTDDLAVDDASNDLGSSDVAIYKLTASNS